MIKKNLLWFAVGLLIHIICFLIVDCEDIYMFQMKTKSSIFILLYALLNSLIIGVLEPWFQIKQKETPRKKQWHCLSWAITFGLPMGFWLYIQQVAFQEIDISFFFLSLVIGLLSGLLAGYIWIKLMMSIANKK